uniref:Uncharacterized protein n=1 Tax=uncultured marine microorganism HF4000_ANIW133B20 TaxID=455528 RepID=B3T3L7_9ZZZZ|nr:hypothetical protein ALOHA_HF4000ANIW133B20ctg3g9 [uncultured marine microorganism HF4000_ANIW133B20]
MMRMEQWLCACRINWCLRGRSCFRYGLSIELKMHVQKFYCD